MLINIGVYNMMGNVFASGVTALFELIIPDLRCTIVEASSLATYALLALGLSVSDNKLSIFILLLANLQTLQNLWSVATYQYIGKRYTVLISLAAFMASNIWAANASSYNSLFTTRIVGGLFGGVVEAVGPAMVVELFPEEELATAMVVYVGFLASGSATGPFFAGLIGTATGDWKWFFRFIAIVSGANFVSCFVMLPESTTTFATETTSTTEPTPTQKEYRKLSNNFCRDSWIQAVQ